MRGRYWTELEVRRFLELQGGLTAADLARALKRSIPAINHMRRKLLFLRQFCPDREDLARLLQVNESAILAGGLRQIRARASEEQVLVRHYVRRAPLSGRRYLIEGHVRQPEGGGL